MASCSHPWLFRGNLSSLISTSVLRTAQGNSPPSLSMEHSASMSTPVAASTTVPVPLFHVPSVTASSMPQIVQIRCVQLPCAPKVFAGSPPRRKALFSGAPSRTRRDRIRCPKDDSLYFDPSKIEPPPYSSYFDSTSSQLEPALGAKASIPGKECWLEGTAARVCAARTPAPVRESAGTPSFCKKPGSRRKGYKEQVASASTANGAEIGGDDVEAVVAIEVSSDDASKEKGFC